MGQVNVTELLSDPDFVDPVQQITRRPSINQHGENILSEVSYSTIGSVQPASGHAIQRLPEDLQVADMSSFWIKGTIISTAPGKYTDILVFRGKRYQVVTVFDWSNWGEGYTEGLCVGESPT